MSRVKPLLLVLLFRAAGQDLATRTARVTCVTDMVLRSGRW